jgi:parallel beta-helix repeat protein
MVRRFGRSGPFLFLILAALLLPLPASAQAVLAVNPTSFSLQAYQGDNVPPQTVQVRNAGKRALKWSVVAPAVNWLSVSPTSGTNTGTLTLTFGTSALPAGTYQTSFRVDSNAGSFTVPVQVSLVAGRTAAPAELVVSCPGNMSVASPDGSPVVVTYSATASGGVAPVTVSGTPVSGSSFAVGTTPVLVTARSSDGQTASCGFSVTVTYSPPPPPPSASAVGPQSTITCPAGAVDIWPGVSIQNVVNSYGGNTTFCLRAGTHSIRSSITPKTGNTFVGEYGAVLDGTGWSATESTQAAFRAHNEDIDYVTIRNLVIRNMPQRGIQAFYWMSDHWTIEYNEIASNLTGISFAPHFIIRNNYIHHNTSGGYLGTYAHSTILENNEIAYNGREQKVGESANVTFRNNFVHHNAGDGIWYDSNNTGALVEGNRVEDNGYSGIFTEISSDIIIRNNTVRRSGNAGMFISTSKNAQIYNNTLDTNFRGILYFVNCSSVGGGSIGFDLANNSAYDNTVIVGTQSDVLANGFSYTLCTSTQVAPYLNGSKNLTFSRNTYYVPSPTTTARYWLWNGLKYWNEWQALGKDGDGVISQK